MQAPLNYTWNHSRWASLSKFITIGREPVADHVRTSLENEFQSREREAVKVKSKKSEAQDTGDSDWDVHPTNSGKPPGASWRSWCCRQRATQGRSNHHTPHRRLRPRRSRLLKEAHAREVRALKKEHLIALKEALFEERRKHQDKQQELVGPLKEALEKAKKNPAEAQVEVSDLTVQVNHEKALRVELEGWLAQGQSLA